MYTKELIKQVKELYPNNETIHNLADSGNEFLGRYLDDSASVSINIDTILLATSLEELQKLAREQKKKVNLYRLWCKEDPRQKIG
jgi:hypothetical protein